MIKAGKKIKSDNPPKGGSGVPEAAPKEQAKALAPPAVPDEATVSKEETVRLIFPCPVALSEAIDAYWHGVPFKSKAAAIRALIERGLKP